MGQVDKAVTVARPRGLRLRALLLLLVPALGGCEGFGRGVTQAVIESASQPGEDTRRCEVEGRPFPGLEPYLARQDGLPPFTPDLGSRPEAKLLYVHGIGTHLPGHGIGLATNLGTSLGLDLRAPRPKRIVLASSTFAGRPLGELNITRLTNEAHTRDLLFYELTWSPITQPDKDVIAFDQDPYLIQKRAGVNQAMRLFVNDIAPDPLAYNGIKREPILASVGQSLCWVISRSWSELPELTTDTMCGPDMPGFGSRVGIDDFAFATHSLGSRVTIDALQRLTNVPFTSDPRIKRVTDQLKDREVQVFMLSNQLPLLESGREPQPVTGKAAAYCGPTAGTAGRFFGKTKIIAFNDPNDLMSYPLPDQYAERFIDSRLCPEITNVTLNVASVASLLGAGEVASPLQAHIGYDTDPRVGGLLAKGAGHAGIAPVVAERCTWRATDESLMK